MHTFFIISFGPFWNTGHRVQQLSKFWSVEPASALKVHVWISAHATDCEVIFSGLGKSISVVSVSVSASLSPCLSLCLLSTLPSFISSLIFSLLLLRLLFHIFFHLFFFSLPPFFLAFLAFSRFFIFIVAMFPFLTMIFSILHVAIPHCTNVHTVFVQFSCHLSLEWTPKPKRCNISRFIDIF